MATTTKHPQARTVRRLAGGALVQLDDRGHARFIRPATVTWVDDEPHNCDGETCDRPACFDAFRRHLDTEDRMVGVNWDWK
jgi:hypothetical protein